MTKLNVFTNNLSVNLTSVPQNIFCNFLLWKFSNTILHESITQVQQWSIQWILFHLNPYSLPYPLLDYFETNLLHHTMIFKVPRKCIKKQRYHFADKVHIVKAMVFPVVMYGWELDYTEGWVPKNWCFWTVVLEKTLEIPLDCKEIKPANPKGNQPWIFIGRIDAEAEAPILWLPDAKSQLTGKDWCWGKLRAGEEGNRSWDSWMASPTQRTWVWANSRRQWRTEKPGVLQSMGSQRVRHSFVTEQL